MSKAKGKEALLLWCQRATDAYPNVDVKNFHVSWQDGLAFCALIHHFRPELIPFDSLKPENKVENLTLAFKVAEQLGIPPLLDVEDLVELPKPEQFSIITYLSQFYHFFGKEKPSLPQTQLKSSTNDAEDDKKRKIPDATSIKSASAVCVKCGKELDGPVIEALGKSYHQSCFGCFDCGKPLKDKCLNVNNNPYCEQCGRKSFVESKKPKKEEDLPAAKDTNKVSEPKTEVSPSPRPAPSLEAKPESEAKAPVIPHQTEKERQDKMLSELEEMEKRVQKKPVPTPPTKPKNLPDSSPATSVEKVRPPIPDKPKNPPPLPSKPTDDVFKPPTKSTPVPPPKPTNLSFADDDSSAPPLPSKPSVEEQHLIVGENKDGPPSRAPPQPPAEPEEVSLRVSYRVSATPSVSSGNKAINQSDLPNLEGYLEKKGDVGVIKTWKRRYFCLRKDRLIYYENQSTKEQDNPIGYIPLQTATSFEKTPDPKKVTGFQIMTTDPDRVWYLRGETEDEIEKWLSACIIHSKWSKQTVTPISSQPKVAATQRAISPLSVAQRKQGSLDKLHDNMGSIASKTLRKGNSLIKDAFKGNMNLNMNASTSWRTRWFVLKEGILWKYNTKSDPKPKKFPLYKCVLEEYNPDNQPTCTQFQLTTNQEHKITLRAPTVEEMHEWLNAILKQKIAIEQIIDNIEL